MKIIGNSQNEILLIALPGENAQVGDYLLVDERDKEAKLVIQIYEESYLEAPGLAETIVREELIQSSTQGVEADPYEIRSLSLLLRDAKLLRCKVRGVASQEGFTTAGRYLPSRVLSIIKKLSYGELTQITRSSNSKKIRIGETADGTHLEIPVNQLDGRLTIITGKKESGKSHLAKLLSAGISDLGALVIVFDLNDEYSSLQLTRRGSASKLAGRLVKLEPGRSLRFTLSYLGKHCVVNVLHHVLDMPGASLREFMRIWDFLDSTNSLTMRSFGAAIESWRCNEFVRDALFARHYSLLSTQLITDSLAGSVTIEGILAELKTGGMIILALDECSSLTRRITVEVILSKLLDLLEKDRIPPIFLFAEEAHLYLRETYWDDLVTRMRHFGIFSTFVTNQPGAIQDNVYRQADNIFLFNFTNENDLEMISRASVTDSETIKKLASMLPPRTCLALGSVVNELPVIFRVAPTEMVTLGETKSFFRVREEGNRDLLRRSASPAAISTQA